MGRQTRVGIALFIVFVVLVTFAYYLWTSTGDVELVPRGKAGESTSEDLEVRLAVPAKPVPPGAGCPVTVTVTNRTRVMLSLADLDQPGGMFRFEVRSGGADVPAADGGSERSRPWDPDTGPRIDLLPGASYSRVLDLAKLSRIQRPGSYSVRVVYDPRAALADRTPLVRARGLWFGRAESSSVSFSVGSVAAGGGG